MPPKKSGGKVPPEALVFGQPDVPRIIPSDFPLTELPDDDPPVKKRT